MGWSSAAGASGAVSVFRLMLEDESGRVRDGGGYKLIVTSGHDATAQTVRAVCLPSGVTPAESR